MAPPGRRRASGARTLQLLALILFFLFPSIHAASAVLGIDIGTEYIKAALVKPGIPLDIVLTKDSKRKEASALAFKPSPYGPQSDDELPERLYGGDALALGARIPADVFPNLKHLLGASQASREESIASYKSRYPALDMYQLANGTLGFNSKSFGANQVSYSVEELLSMELKTIRENAEAMAGSSVRDAVVTIPAFYNAGERRSLEYALQLAGFRVLGLVSDGMAVGLNYAMTRTFGVVDTGAKPEYHLVYDMGAGSTTATVLRMQGKRVKDVGRFNKTVQQVTTLGVGWDRTLGGDALNDLIVNDMVEQFVETAAAQKAGIQASTIKGHGRTMAKFWKDSERLRQILSANTEASSFFESCYDDIDFRYKLSRASFESTAAEYSARVSKPIADALESAGMKIEDITSVILHGGAVRTPFIQSNLEKTVGSSQKLRTSVNADEAAVFGAAFKGAGLSPSFRVKEIEAVDVAIYPITVQWQTAGKERSQQIFTSTSQTGAIKQMPFSKMNEDFSFSFRQKLPLIDVDAPILQVQTVNLTASVAKLIIEHGCVKENVTSVFAIRLDPGTGMPEVLKASVSCESSTVEKASMMDGVKGMLGFGKKDKPAAESDEGEMLEPLTGTSATSASSSTAASSSSGSTAPSASDSAKGKDKSTAPVKKTHTITVEIASKGLGLAQPVGPELQRIKDGLALFDKSDQGRRLREELYNGLEAFTYRVRDMLGDRGFASVSTSEQRGQIGELLRSTSDWLSEEGLQASMDTIKAKLQRLRALVDPVSRRREEQSSRPLAIQGLQKALESAAGLKDSISAKIASAGAETGSSLAAAASSASSSFSASATRSTASETRRAGAQTPSDGGDDLEDVDGDGDRDGDDPNPEDDPEFAETLASLKAQLSAYAESAYTEADLTRLGTALDKASTWLTEKLASQGALQDSDEPAFFSVDVEEQGAKLMKIVDELTRKAQYQSNSSGGGSSTTSKRATKKPKTSSVSGTGSASASTGSAGSTITVPVDTGAMMEPEASGVPEAKASKGKDKGSERDEL